MIGVEQRLPDLSDKELDSLRANAERIARSGPPAQRGAAEALLPHIGAEKLRRAEAAPITGASKRRTTPRLRSAPKAVKAK